MVNGCDEVRIVEGKEEMSEIFIEEVVGEICELK